MFLNKINIMYVIVGIILLMIPINYVSLEHKVYFWDLSGYWNFWRGFANDFSINSVDAVRKLLSTVRNDDYNQLPILIPSLFSIFPMDSRLSYILSIVVFYFIPVIFLINYLLSIVDVKYSQMNSIVFSFLLSTSIVFWAPILRGYPDICGLIFILCSIIFTLKNDFTKKISLRKAILLGILLWLPFVLRRWYAYTIVSLYLSLPILNLFYYKIGRISFNAIKNVLFNFFIAGLVTIGFSLIFQFGLINRIISVNYSEIYSAYQNGFMYSLSFFRDNLGVFSLIIFCIGILGIKKENLFFVWFCLFNLIFSFFLFTRTQTPGIQHNLPFALWVTLISFLGISRLINKMFLSRYIVIILSFLISGCVMLYSLFNYPILSNNYYATAQFLPVKVANYSEYLRLNNFLQDKLIGSTDKVTIYSSSGILNGQMLSSLSEQKLDSYITSTKDVDLRDLLNIDGLMSKYVIVTNPIQIHLGSEAQKVVTIPVESILENKNIGNAYKKLDTEFKLSDDVVAYIYEKYRAFSTNELDLFLNEFYTVYPNWKLLYEKKSLKTYLTSFDIKGDVWGSYGYNNGIFELHPGENLPTIVYYDNIEFSMLELDSWNLGCNTSDPMNILISSPLKNSSHILNKGEKISLSIQEYGSKNIKFVIDKFDNSLCDSVNLRFY